MDSLNIHNSKYTTVSLPELYAPRSELIARLDEAAQSRLIFISAPAGSGKTVSTNIYAKNSGRKTIWIGLDAYDNYISVFYRLFCTGILSVQPDNEQIKAILNDPSFNSSPIEHAMNLLSVFRADEAKYVLAIDDFHTITNNEILKSLPYILRRLPHSFVTLVMSRGEPSEYFEDFIEQGEMEVVTAEAMVFGKGEIKEYYSLLGRQISENDAKAVSDYTGGWAIGVSALAQSAAPLTDGGEGYGGQVLSNYIEKHLWREWNEDLRKFMLSSAVLDEIPVSLCVEITSREDSGELLENLRMRNAFVSRIDDGVYRYHHLFLDFLRAQPEYIKANKKKCLNAAVEYYMYIGDNISAQRYAYESGNARNILKLYDTYMYDNSYNLEDYLDIARSFYFTPALEALISKYPVLNIVRAFTALLVGNAKLFEEILDSLRPSIPLVILRYPRFGELAVGIDGVDYRVSLDKLMTKAEWIPKIVFQESTFRQGFLTFEMPFLHRSSRDYAELSDPNIFAKVENTFGKLFKSHFEIIVLHCVVGGLLLEQNHLNEALTKHKEGVALSASWMAREARFAANMHLAAAYLALNKTDELMDIIQETEEFVQTKAQHLRPNFLAFTARVKLWDGNTAAAEEWLAEYFVNEGKTLELYRTYQYFTTARAYSVLGELEKAKDLCLRLKQMGKDFNRIQDIAEAEVLLAAILLAEGEKDEAQELLEAVLFKLQPYEFVRLVADEGAAIFPIVKKIHTRCNRSNYKGKLDSMYVNNVYLATHAVSKQRSGIMANLEVKPVKLSKKQKLVIELLAQGHKRENIMEKTGMALGTFKTHIRIAYEKLDVNNADDAILKARELGII